MGFAISWIAFPHKSADAVASLLGLTRTGEFQDVPESPFSGALLPTGWYVVVINEYGHDFALEKSLKRLSASSPVVSVLIEEHVMASSAEYWDRGTCRWAIRHQGDSGPGHLEDEGAPPPPYEEIKQRQLAAQQDDDEVDYLFDVPLELAQTLAGYRHDGPDDIQFEVLTEAPKPDSGGFFGRIFGKK